MATVIECLRNAAACSHKYDGCGCLESSFEHLPALLALADAVKAVRDEETTAHWDAMVKALADLEKEAP